jgi:hypothetical protein
VSPRRQKEEERATSAGLGLKSMGVTLEERNDDEHKSPSNLRVN